MVGRVLSVYPYTFAPGNLKIGGKDMKHDKDLAFRPECENEDDLLLTEEERAEIEELLSKPDLKDIPYKLVHDKEVPLSPLMKIFILTFEFCNYRYVVVDHFSGLDAKFDYDRFQFLLLHEYGIRVNLSTEWTLENMKALMLRVESEITPEYKERLMEKWEDFKECRKMFFDLINLCSQSKRLTIISNVAFADINFEMLNLELYNEYGIYLSMADRIKLDTVGKMVYHILFRLYDGRHSF